MRVPVKKQIGRIVLEEVGCVAKTQWTSLPGCSIFHDQTASAVQMAALRTRDYCLRGPLVSAVLAFVSLMERGLPADHTTIWRWVQRYALELNRRCRRELKPTNGSWRVDETYICQGGNWRYLYRAVDSTGATIDFWFSAERDAAAAKQFFQKALQTPGHPRPRVIGRWQPVLPKGDRRAEAGA